MFQDLEAHCQLGHFIKMKKAVFWQSGLNSSPMVIFKADSSLWFGLCKRLDNIQRLEKNPFGSQNNYLQHPNLKPFYMGSSRLRGDSKLTHPRIQANWLARMLLLFPATHRALSAGHASLIFSRPGRQRRAELRSCGAEESLVVLVGVGSEIL